MAAARTWVKDSGAGVASASTSPSAHLIPCVYTPRKSGRSTFRRDVPACCSTHGPFHNSAPGHRKITIGPVDILFVRSSLFASSVIRTRTLSRENILDLIDLVLIVNSLGKRTHAENQDLPPPPAQRTFPRDVDRTSPRSYPRTPPFVKRIRLPNEFR